MSPRKYPVRQQNEFKLSKSGGTPQFTTAVNLARSGLTPSQPTGSPVKTTSVINSDVFCADNDRSSLRTHSSKVRRVVIFSVKSSPEIPPSSVNNSNSVPTI